MNHKQAQNSYVQKIKKTRNLENKIDSETQNQKKSETRIEGSKIDLVKENLELKFFLSVFSLIFPEKIKTPLYFD